MNAARLHSLLEDAGYEPRPYSGRCMYGDVCLAVETDAASGSAKVVLDAVQACAENGTVEEVQDLVELLRNSRSDSMGRGTVIYWPNIAWADCGADEEEDHGDDDGGFRHTGEEDRAPSSGREDFCRGT
jgi:hypothetical protein